MWTRPKKTHFRKAVHDGAELHVVGEARVAVFVVDHNDDGDEGSQNQEDENHSQDDATTPVVQFFFLSENRTHEMSRNDKRGRWLQIDSSGDLTSTICLTLERRKLRLSFFNLLTLQA